MKKKSKRKSNVKFTVLAISLTVIIGAALATAAILISLNADDGGDETSETTVEPFEIEYDGFIPTGNQTVYAYCDADGDGRCDDGANIFVRPEPTVDVGWTEEIFRGTELIRTAVYYANGKDGDGWSKILYEGEVYYVQNRYLSESDPGPGVAITLPN